MTARLIYGIDVIEGLRKLEDESVQCVVTSPPYWALRDYGVEGQIGLEKTPEEFIEKMVAVFREVRRVLRKDGVAWVNMGDGYCSSDKWGGGKSGNTGKHTVDSAGGVPSWAVRKKREKIEGIKPKDLVGMPWMLAFALRADGWYLRSDVIWAKPNPMPESVTDRPTKAHEYIFLLTKSEKYFYDADAVSEASVRAGENPGGGIKFSAQALVPGSNKQNLDKLGLKVVATNRNKRTVWEIATEPYPEAHFATFPREIPKVCILAGTSAYGSCAECRAPWARIVETTRTFESGSGKSGRMPNGKNGSNLQGGGETKDIRLGPCVTNETKGWKPTCKHDAARVPCVVLDPFSGSATTGEVAVGLGRHYVGIDLNIKYLELATKRLGLFATVENLL